jgi:glycosyltransferase involved in cell wall biosynthesis
MNHPLVSIVVPIYNTPEQLLRKCIGSILTQTYKNIEIILVNDCSGNPTSAVIQEFSGTDPRIKVISKHENGGVSSARNDGLDIMTGDYFTFVDHDDFIDNGRIEYLVDQAVRTQADIVVTSLKNIDEDGRQIYSDSPPNKIFNLNSRIERVSALPYLDYFVWTKLFKAEMFREIRFKVLPGTIAEDSIFSIECFLKASTMTLSCNTSYNWRHRSLSGSHSEINRGFIDSEIIACIEIKQAFDANGYSDIYLKYYWKPVYQRLTLLIGKIAKISDSIVKASLLSYLKNHYFESLVHLVPKNRYHHYYCLLFKLNSPKSIYYFSYFVYRNPIHLIGARLATYKNARLTKNC